MPIQLPRLLSRTVSSDVLLGDMKQLFIVHDEQIYQLRITKLGKLILTK
jgi:hemin uptake protein HemP